MRMNQHHELDLSIIEPCSLFLRLVEFWGPAAGPPSLATKWIKGLFEWAKVKIFHTLLSGLCNANRQAWKRRAIWPTPSHFLHFQWLLNSDKLNSINAIQHQLEELDCSKIDWQNLAANETAKQKIPWKGKTTLNYLQWSKNLGTGPCI